jgi:hypothetical protein
MGAPESTTERITIGRLGAQAHVGSQVKVGETYPALVMRSSSPANILVFPDGSDALWRQSIEEGQNEGQWMLAFE